MSKGIINYVSQQKQCNQQCPYLQFADEMYSTGEPLSETTVRDKK